MDITDALNRRRTCRAFQPDQVEKETIEDILKDAIHAPSWSNTQPWEIYVATGPVIERMRTACLENYKKGAERKPDIPVPEKWPEAETRRMHEMGAERFKALGIDREDKAGRAALTELNYRFFDAPVVIYLCMDKTLGAWSMFDLGSLAQSIMLAAEEEGLATAPALMLVAYPDIIRKELEIPVNQSIVIGIAMGYEDKASIQNTFMAGRRPLKEVAHYTGFKQ